MTGIFNKILEKWTEKRRQESVRRMDDTEYALKLKAFGYDVPEKYLSRKYAENNDHI